MSFLPDEHCFCNAFPARFRFDADRDNSNASFSRKRYNECNSFEMPFITVAGWRFALILFAVPVCGKTFSRKAWRSLRMSHHISSSLIFCRYSGAVCEFRRKFEHLEKVLQIPESFLLDPNAKHKFQNISSKTYRGDCH